MPAVRQWIRGARPPPRGGILVRLLSRMAERNERRVKPGCAFGAGMQLYAASLISMLLSSRAA